MKSFFYMLMALCLLAQNSLARRADFRISGRVSDVRHQPLVAANVVLLDSNNQLIKAEITAPDGTFNIENVPAGEFSLKILLEGFESFSTGKINLAADKDLQEIILEENRQTLNEVTVRAKKPLIEAYADKLVVNVENSITSTGSTVMEVLEHAPNVSVDQNDNISLKGKQSVTVMINGKLVPVKGTELANLLKGMPAESVEKIELISNPGARYEAAGTAGIINIKTKKIKSAGFNGGINASYIQGFNPKFSGGFSLNYRNEKLSLYGSYSGNYRKGINDLTLDRRFINHTAAADTIFRQRIASDNDHYTHFLNFGADYHISPKTILGTAFNIGISGRDFKSENRNDIFAGEEKQVFYFKTKTDNENRWNHFSMNLNLRHQFDSSGREISGDADFAKYFMGNNQALQTDFMLNDGSVLKPPYRLEGDMKGFTEIRSVKLDYVYPVNKTTRLEAGLKSGFVTSDNNPLFYQYNNGRKEQDPGKSNHFIYNENINAAYLNASKNFEKWSLMAGLRAEQTYVRGAEKMTDTSFVKQYTNLFPNVALVRHLDKNHDLGLSLARRIDRPNYMQLNPFKNYLDISSVQQGNPDLNPSLTYSAELNHIYKNRFTTSLGYSYTSNVITQVIKPGTDALGGKITIITDDNLATNHVYSVSGSYPFQITKWWQSVYSANLYYTRFEGNLANTPLNESSPAFQISTNNSFLLPGGWSAELNGWYQSEQQYGYMFLRPMYSLNAGIQKSLWQNKATLKIAVNDIFQMMNPRGTSNFNEYREVFIVKRDTRAVALSFSYRFGNRKTGVARQKTGGAEEEKRRAAGGTGF